MTRSVSLRFRSSLSSTVHKWIKKGKIKPSVEYKFGSKSLYLFSPDDVEKYRKELGIKEHNNDTIKQDFFEFLEERDYSLSYKMPFLLAFVKNEFANSFEDYLKANYEKDRYFRVNISNKAIHYKNI